MSSIKLIAVERAVVLLKASGCAYKVICEDGTEYGDLAVIPVKAARTRKHVHSFRHLYSAQLDAMKPGDTQIWEHEHAEPLRSSISAAACTRWGSGNSISRVEGRKVELLRVA